MNNSVEKKEDPLFYWRLAGEYSVWDTAFLIIGADPEGYKNAVDAFAHLGSAPKPDGFDAVYTSLKNEVLSGALKAMKRYGNGTEEGNEHELNWKLTTIKRADIVEWLSHRGVRAEFFFAGGVDVPDYMNPDSELYAPKLAAAVKAWEAVTTNEELLNGKTPKMALEKWLRENANQYGLCGEDGMPNETGIEQICKVANWKLSGGAAKTKG